MTPSKKCLTFALFVAMLSALVMACSDTNEAVRTSPEELYHRAMIQLEEESYNEAITDFNSVITSYPGTRLATYSYLKLGDAHFDREEWEESDSNYRFFLNLNPKSHLTPYVLHRLIALNYQRNFQGIFFQTRDYDRDMEPNRRIVNDYQVFFFIYPQNAYLQDVKDYMIKARADLAAHEFLVGNFYFEQDAYQSAILRYLYLLKNYPEYPHTQEVVDQLIKAYEANQQPEYANEIRRVIKGEFNQQP